MSPSVRPARQADAAAIAAIYGYYVLNSTATFDTEPPDAAWWRGKIADVTDRGWPFLVAVRDGNVVGYCFATQFRDRAAYVRTCENSIYVADEARRSGVGRMLLDALIPAARASGFEQMIAVVGGGEPPSVALHRALGFVEAGRMRHVGYKFGRRLDTVYMQYDLTAGDAE